MPFTKGNPKPHSSGRKKGTPNRVTHSMRQAYALAFEQVGGVDALADWARKHPHRFYPLASKLIPHDITLARADGPSRIRIEFVPPNPENSHGTAKAGAEQGEAGAF